MPVLSLFFRRSRFVIKNNGVPYCRDSDVNCVRNFRFSPSCKTACLPGSVVRHSGARASRSIVRLSSASTNLSFGTVRHFDDKSNDHITVGAEQYDEDLTLTLLTLTLATRCLAQEALVTVTGKGKQKWPAMEANKIYAVGMHVQRELWRQPCVQVTGEVGSGCGQESR